MTKSPRIRLLIDFLKENSGAKVLDIGNLGDGGHIHEYLISQLGESSVFGLDIADQKAKGKNYPNQYVGAAEKMPFDDGTFDLVYIGEVIEHTWHPFEMVKESKRVLKSAGTLIIDTPNIYSISRMMRYVVRGKDYILGEPTHKIFFSKAVLENLLHEVGFEVDILTTDNKFTMFGKTIMLPPFGVVRAFGEHLLCRAKNK